MDDPFFMGRFQTFRELLCNNNHFLYRHRPAFQPEREILSFHKLQCQSEISIGFF